MSWIEDHANEIAEAEAQHDARKASIQKMVEALDSSCYSKLREHCDCSCCKALEAWRKANE